MKTQTTNLKVIFPAICLMFAACAHAPKKEIIKWHTVTPGRDGAFSILGLPWAKENANFIRLPMSKEAMIKRENSVAWDEALCPSGARVRFKTDSSQLRIRALHGDERTVLYHMPSTGVAGMDLYETVQGSQVFRGTSRPRSGKEHYENIYFEGGARVSREFTLYLPTYAKLKSLEIGLDPDAQVDPATPYKVVKPIVFYGSSITQSGCASRGSNGFVPQISRMLGADVVNLGFSGSGKGEEWMADLVAQVDASIYVIDSVANMGERIQGKSLMELNYKRFVKLIRSKHPKTPIVLMTRIRYADVNTPRGDQIRDTDESYRELHAPLYETYNELKARGDRKIWIFDAAKVIPRGAEHPSVDGIHLNDRGFWEMAQALAPLLGKILRQ